MGEKRTFGQLANRHMKVIQRREEYLARLIANGESGSSESWDRAELAALRWVIETIGPRGLGFEGNTKMNGAAHD